jgi:uncharacterized protein YifN (PemK superfamily)
VALSFHPDRGSIVICDYSTGFRPPEMVKVRPVVVVSPRRRSTRLLTVVPISSSAPMPAEPWHYLLPSGRYPPARGPVWVKADLVSTVAIDRLDRVKVRDVRGIQIYCVFQLEPCDMRAIDAAVKAALGFA